MLRTAVIAAVLTLAGRSAAAQGTTPTTAPRDTTVRSVVPFPTVVDSSLLLRGHRRGPGHAFRICAGGDVTLGTNLDTAWARIARKRMRKELHASDAPDSLLAPLRPLFAGADIVLLNVEGAIGSGHVRSKCSRYARNCFAFRQPPQAARALRRVVLPATLVGNVANNHSHDAGKPGFKRTQALLRHAGVLVTGADTLATPVRTPAGDTIGILGFHTSDETPDARDLDAVRRYVAHAVDRWGTVIVTMHLGGEGAAAQRTADSTEVFLDMDRGNPVAFANTALDAGATMVVGHGPHVLRAAEWHDGRLVLYSLGNLLTYGPFTLREPMNRGAIACATIGADGAVRDARLRPTMQTSAGIVRPDTTGRAITLVDSLSALDFPLTGTRVSSDGSLTPRTSAAASDEKRPRR